jgi:photosynthetic reaction center cytochrome c subunit
MVPLTSVFPEHRLGATGDVAKANCATCHQGINKPLYGVSMLGDYPFPTRTKKEQAKATTEGGKNVLGCDEIA